MSIETGYADFCQKYKEMLETEEYIKENNIEFDDCKHGLNEIYFSVLLYKTPIGQFPLYNQGENLFRLDEQDLEYLYNKYIDKAKEEATAYIEETKKKNSTEKHEEQLAKVKKESDDRITRAENKYKDLT